VRELIGTFLVSNVATQWEMSAERREAIRAATTGGGLEPGAEARWGRVQWGRVSQGRHGPGLSWSWRLGANWHDGGLGGPLC
jgi:hypothetical protein